MKTYPGQEIIMMEYIINSSFAFTLGEHVALKLKSPMEDGTNVIQLSCDTEHGFYPFSFGIFNEHDGARIEDSGKDVIQFLTDWYETKQQEK